MITSNGIDSEGVFVLLRLACPPHSFKKSSPTMSQQRVPNNRGTTLSFPHMGFLLARGTAETQRTLEGFECNSTNRVKRRKQNARGAFRARSQAAEGGARENRGFRRFVMRYEPGGDTTFFTCHLNSTWPHSIRQALPTPS